MNQLNFLKSITVIILFFLQIQVGFSQVPTIEWENSFGGTWYDYSSGGQQTPDGGFVVAGVSNSPISNDKTENPLGGSLDRDYWIVKLNEFGTIEWDNTIGGHSTEFLQSIELTNDGGFILGGSSQSDSSGDKSENSSGSRDCWLVKLDSLGNIQWENTLGGAGFETAWKVRQTDDGGYILGGFSDSDISGDKSQNSLGDKDYWVVKLDSSGLVQWDKTIGGVDTDILQDIIQTNDGGYLLGGKSQSDISVHKSENIIGGEDYWIVKLDSNGNIEWDNTIGGTSEDRLTCIGQAKDGGYILGGHSLSNNSNDKSESAIGTWDFWVVKVDALGNVEWENTIGGTDPDFLYSIEQTIDGGYILGGSSTSVISGDKIEENLGSTDIWIVKLNNLGLIQWQKVLGGSTVDAISSIQQTKDCGYFISAHSTSGISSDKSEENYSPSSPKSDYWAIKLYPEPVCNSNLAQNVKEQNTFSVGSEYQCDIDKTTDGHYVLGGTSDPLGQNTSKDYSLSKLRGDMDSLWTRTYSSNSTSNDECEKVINTLSGYILAGYSQGGVSADKTENSLGGQDFWILKTDTAGTRLWDNTIGGSGNDYLSTGIKTYDGGFLFGGYSDSPISGDKSEANRGQSDYWIVKTDEDGIVQWDKTFGGSGRDELNSLHQTNDGGFLLGGTSASIANTGDKTSTLYGIDDYWIIKVDNDGNMIWQESYGGANTETLISAYETKDGGYFLAGNSRSNASGVKTANRYGGNYHDYWVLKLDASRNIVWQKTIGGNYSDLLSSSVLMANNSHVLVGYSQSNVSGDKSENAYGMNDYWIVSLNEFGNIEWEKTFGGTGIDRAYALTESFNCGLVIAGSSDSPISGNKTVSHKGNRDFWLIELNIPENIWQGTMSDDWSTHQNWLKGFSPSIEDVAIIPSTPVGGQFPIIRENIDVGKVDIEPLASCSVKATKGITIADSSAVVSNGTFHLLADENGTAWVDDFTNTDAYITGSMVVELYIPDDVPLSQFYFGSPLNQDSKVHGLDQTYTGYPLGPVIVDDCDSVILAPNSPYSNMFEWHEYLVDTCAMDGWVAVKDTTTLENCIGYNGWMQGGSTIEIKGFGFNTEGNMNTVLIDTSSLSFVPYGSGWFLLSNPFPSSLDIDALFDVNGPMFFSPTVYNGTTRTYEPIFPGESIGVGQAFFAEGGSVGSIFAPKNQYRNKDGGVFKNNISYDIELSIEITGGGNTDKTYLYYNYLASDSFDLYWDRKKRPSDFGVPTLFTGLEGEELSLNVQSMQSFGQSIPMGLKPGSYGQYTLKFEGLTTLPHSCQIFLEDKLTNTWLNVQETSHYTFNALTADFVDRFEIHFSKPIELSTMAETCEGSDGQLEVDFGSSLINGNLLEWNFTVSDSTDLILSGTESGVLNLDGLLEGEYTIEMIYGSDTIIEQVLIAGIEQVSASFIVSQTQIEVGEELSFENTAMNYTSHEWLINNEVFYDEIINYTFNTPGEYEVVLHASNSDCASTFSRNIRVNEKWTNIEDVSNLSQVNIYNQADEIIVDLSKLNRKEVVDVEIFNMLGQVIFQKSDVQNVEVIPLKVPVGIYVVSVQIGSEIFSKKLVLGQ